MQCGRSYCPSWRGHVRPALACGFVATLLANGFGAAHAGEPGALDETTKAPLCCGAPPRDEVTADQVFGRWVVTRAGIGVPLRSGEHVEFRPDGTLTTSRGPCRFAVLRAELTVACADESRTGEVRFVDDTKLLWRLDGREALFIAPTD